MTKSTSRLSSTPAKEPSMAQTVQSSVTFDRNSGKYLAMVTDQVQEFTSETLPDWMRQGVGMLKLVEPETVVAHVGARVSDNTFFIVNTGE